jgi:hypothetical protein
VRDACGVRFLDHSIDVDHARDAVFGAGAEARRGRVRGAFPPRRPDMSVEVD